MRPAMSCLPNVAMWRSSTSFVAVTLSLSSVAARAGAGVDEMRPPADDSFREHDSEISSQLQRAGREFAFANSRLRVARGEAVADADEFLHFALQTEVEVVGGLVVEAEDDRVVVLLPLLVRKRVEQRCGSALDADEAGHWRDFDA